MEAGAKAFRKLVDQPVPRLCPPRQFEKHDDPADPDALEELDDAVKDMNAMLAFYEQVLVERGIKLPY